MTGYIVTGERIIRGYHDAEVVSENVKVFLKLEKALQFITDRKLEEPKKGIYGTARYKGGYTYMDYEIIEIDDSSEETNNQKE